MDKSWIGLKNRVSREYIDGVDNFLDFAYDHSDNPYIKCPCRKCLNRFFHTRDSIREHVIVDGFMENYKTWTIHGEGNVSFNNDHNRDNFFDYSEEDDMVRAVQDGMWHQPNLDTNNERINDETIKFMKMLEEAKKPLFPNCNKFTSLSFIVRLLQLKVINGWTNNSFTSLLELLKEAFEVLGVQLPRNFYEANKISTDFGFTYETWDACPNNCMLFRNDDKYLDKCTFCEASRYKQFDCTQTNAKDCRSKKKDMMPAKQVRYFPLKPRLQRLYATSKTAKDMKWHSEGRKEVDGVMRHVADSPSWKLFDERYPNFASEIRNVRLGLAADGFNPFGNMNISHSTWPVLLIPYNLPPWLCMKQSSFILSVLIDGPQAPNDKIDVYMQPLIEELKDLWYNGVTTYDASTKQMFQLRATLLWTINDFPAYGNLSGWSTKGRYACPTCNKEVRSFRLPKGSKFCYWGHRRWLEPGHKFRRDKLSFDGKADWSEPPKLLSGSELLEQLRDVETVYKKEDLLSRMKASTCKGSKRRRVEVGDTNTEKQHNWKKKSILWELPYWEYLVLRHNLDGMHIEKNFCDNVLFTVLCDKVKSKDNLNSRLDLQDMNIRKPLHSKEGPSGKILLPPASFMMSKSDKDLFLKVLKFVKVPDGYASNISRCVHLKERTIRGLKSHDNHILMQELLPIACRRALPKNVVQVLIELSSYFRILFSKTIQKVDIEYIKGRIPLILCQLEKIFPPSFFDIMEHLPIHLADEALVGGPIQYRWMYPIERYLHTLKCYVRNRARPEASIAKGFILEECMNFFERYMADHVVTKSNRPSRNDEGDDHLGCHFGGDERFMLENVEWEQAHNYVLANVDEVEPYRKKHLAFLKRKMLRVQDRQLYKAHNEQFSSWFTEHVHRLQEKDDHHLSDYVMKLAAGPMNLGRRYKGYCINGFRFRTRESNNSRVTYNSGVMLNANLRSYASIKDNNPSTGDVSFYGELTDIIEVYYTNDIKFVLFKCDWVDNSRGKKQDEFKFTLVNFNHLLYKDNKVADEPFILASQASQVIYIDDPAEPGWSVALKIGTRDYFHDIDSSDEVSLDSTLIRQVQPFEKQAFDESRITHEDDPIWLRNGVDFITVDEDDV